MVLIPSILGLGPHARLGLTHVQAFGHPRSRPRSFQVSSDHLHPQKQLWDMMKFSLKLQVLGCRMVDKSFQNIFY